ncbi:MAG: hypothetical protein ACFFFC_02320 [Candidatus Thorarchaeota archaeon]
MRVSRASVVPLIITLLLFVAALSVVVPLNLERPSLPPEENINLRIFQETLNDTNNEFQYTVPHEAIRCYVGFISTNGSPVSLRVHNATGSIFELRNLTYVHTDFEFETAADYTYYVTVTRQTQNTVNFSLFLYLWYLSSFQPQQTTYEGNTLVSVIAAIFTGMGISWFVQKAARLHSVHVIRKLKGRKFRSEIIPLIILSLTLMGALSVNPLIAGYVVGDFDEVLRKEVLKTETHSIVLNSENPIMWVNITVPNVYTGPTTYDPMTSLPPPIYLRLFDISSNGEPALINRSWEQFILHYESEEENWWIRISTSSGATMSLGFERVVSDVELSFNAEIYHYTASPLVNPLFAISLAILGVISLVLSFTLACYLGEDIQTAANQSKGKD